MFAAPTVAADFDVTLFVTGDTHYGEVGINPNNKAQIAAMNGLPGTPYPPEIGGFVATPMGVLIAGDLTEGGEQSEWDAFVADYGLDGTDGLLDYPVYECAGDHDLYAPAPTVQSGITARHGTELFTARFGPLYVASAGVSPAFPNQRVLEQNLADMGFDRPIVLFHHFGFDQHSIDEAKWPESAREAYRQTIEGHNVVAICQGHSHTPGFSTWEGHKIYRTGSAKGIGSQNVIVAIRITGDMMTSAIYHWTTDGLGNWTGGNWVAWDTQSISTPVPPCDCNRNGAPDNQDIADSTSSDGNGNDYPDECEPAVLFVDQDATAGRNVGTSWTDAFTDLMDAIEVAEFSAGMVREIWVAEGVYRPHRGTSEQRRTFRLVDSVGLYGGFAGGETQRAQRDPSAHVTELNGEDASDPLNPINVYHVVTATGNDQAAILDGFTVRGGRANGEAEQEHGGGVLVNGGTPTFVNCLFTANTARFGGGVGNIGASPAVINCVFVGNTQAAGGGLGAGRTGGAAMCNSEGSAPTITNCTFVANSAERNGGGIYNKDGNPLVTNCIFWANADRNGTAESSQIHTYRGAPIVTYSCVQDGAPDDATVYPGAGNIDDDPRFLDAGAGDLRLSDESPCIDAGSNAAPNLPTTDRDGRPRVVNGTVDMGAYEAPIAADLDLTFFVASGVHYGHQDGEFNNLAQIAAMNELPGTPFPPEIGGTVGTPVAVVVTGDLTEDGTPGQWDSFAAHYGLDGTDGLLNYPVLEGPGNHDDDYPSLPVHDAIIARHGGLPYSADLGPIHVISLTLIPSNDDLRILRLDLADGDYDRPIVVFHHVPPDGSEWSDTFRERYREALEPYNVLGLFHGHTHVPDIYEWEAFDVYSSGAAKETGPQNAFLVVRVTEDTMSVAIYHWTTDGAGQWTGGAWVDWQTKPIYLPPAEHDCNGNGTHDEQDIALGTSEDANENGYPDECEPAVLYVDADSSAGRNVGTSWADAYTDLQDAIDRARDSDGLVTEIWVAEGTYRPDRGTESRLSTFRLRSGMALYGGFTGNETHRDQRDPALYLSELNGEFNVEGEIIASYHVVTAGGTDQTAILDGFTITGGVANGESGTHDRGAGLYNDGGDPTIANCTFRDNQAARLLGSLSKALGGGVFSDEGSPKLVNCVFDANTAEHGGGLWIGDGAPVVVNCTFTANSANGRRGTGGGIYVSSGSPTIVNSILWGNTAETGTVETAQLYGSTAVVGHSCLQDSDPDDAIVHPGTGNIDDDPRFADTDFRLASDSPCIDAGDSTAVLADVHIDRDGNPRLQNHPDVADTGVPVPPGLVVDMGACEVLGLPNLIRIVGGADAADGSASLIWPKADDLGLDAFEIEVDQPTAYVASATTTTEAGTSPSLTGLAHLGDGIHRVELDEAIPVGHWTIITLTVAGATGIESTFTLDIGHLPGDINEDGEVNMNDATAFGSLFRAGPDAPQRDRIDLNNDGQANLNDATLLGQLWRGTSGHQQWQNASLPPRP